MTAIITFDRPSVADQAGTSHVKRSRSSFFRGKYRTIDADIDKAALALDTKHPGSTALAEKKKHCEGGKFLVTDRRRCTNSNSN